MDSWRVVSGGMWMPNRHGKMAQLTEPGKHTVTHGQDPAVAGLSRQAGPAVSNFSP